MLMLTKESVFGVFVCLRARRLDGSAAGLYSAWICVVVQFFGIKSMVMGDFITLHFLTICGGHVYMGGLALGCVYDTLDLYIATLVEGLEVSVDSLRSGVGRQAREDTTQFGQGRRATGVYRTTGAFGCVDMLLLWRDSESGRLVCGSSFVGGDMCGFDHEGLVGRMEIPFLVFWGWGWEVRMNYLMWSRAIQELLCRYSTL
ncbi:hypothetical protein Tco_0859635 [Tanacetum coccineum]|uniref:Uncharacterized protein n=1 Tax=Tanacetum coccineum TaxID=301880 RepID=A0ABQ5BDI9_9ASTR